MRRPKLPDEFWFRITTRFRAGGYWVREKAQKSWRGLRAAGVWAGDHWMRLSRGARYSALGLLVVAVLIAVVRFAPVPGIPCQVSAVRECAPSDGAVALVPADAMLYAHLTLDQGTDQFYRAEALPRRLPGLSLNAERLISFVPTPSGAQVSFGGDVRPWASDDFALELLPGKGRALPALIVGVGDREAASDFVSLIAPPGKPKLSDQGGAALSVYGGGFASAFSGDNLIIGTESAVRASLRVAAGAPGLEGSKAASSRDQLPDLRFADLFLSRTGVERLLAGGGAGSTQLDTFVDYGATSGFAVAATARDDGLKLELVSDLQPKQLESSPSFFTELPEFEPGLADDAGERALAYVGVGELGPTVAGLLKRAGSGQPGLVRSLQALSAGLKRSADVDPLADLLPALSGQAALVAEPTDGVPFASVIVDGVDQEKASQAIAKLQEPLLRSVTQSGRGQIPAFEQQQIDGVAVRSVQISPSVDLSYAIFDDKLVVSTDPAGVAQVRSGGGSLADTQAYEVARDELPDEVAAIVFLNIQELQDRAELAGLAEDPVYASLREDISEFEALALGVTGSDDQLKTELFLPYD
ncbi:MAG: DUF3352 domain-containing protein [Solirubrobacterales bacterium]|nr:DUF3352 domain-containing protein [Solirubrobacterales bacterium]